MKKWSVGSFIVSEVQEFAMAVGLLDGVVAQATPEVVLSTGWMRPDYATDDGRTLWDVHSYVVDTGEQVILVDAGVGNDKQLPMQSVWTELHNPFLDRLAEAGYEREDVDIVLLTHLHLDHVGWCSMKDEIGDWVPTFPNARLILVRDEYNQHLAKILSDEEKSLGVVDEDMDPIARAFHAHPALLSEQTELIQSESLQPVIDAGHLELVSMGAEIVPGVRYESTAGHTSAHNSVRIESNGESAFITGDFIHHPMQIAHPDWSSTGDWDGEISARNRRAFFEETAGTRVLVLGTHFAGSGAGYIVEDGHGYRLISAPPQ
jgi:glyoxylase-like metal-dependent hydrolase (beta-lactamase superfamily II)